MVGTVLVTAATGTVGRHVAGALAERPVTVRLGSRDPTGLDRPGEPTVFDFERPATWVPALAGVDAVFLVRPPAVATGRVIAFARTASCADRVVYLSTLGAEKNPLVPHHRIERAIATADVAHTFLRASFFMQNLLEVHRPEIVGEDEIVVPAGDGTTSFVDARDVAAAGAMALLCEDDVDREYDLTGPDALGYDAVARIFSEVLGRPITYADPSIPAFVRRMRARGLSWGFIAVMVAIYTTARLGLAGRVTDDVERVLGRPARDLRRFVADHADAFRPASA